MLIGRSSQSQPALPGPGCPGPAIRPARPALVRPALIRPAATRQVAVPQTAPSRLTKILGEPAGPKRSRQSQCPRECPPTLRFLEASQAGMQVCAPARPSRRRIGNDLVPGCHQAKQVRLSRAGSASHTGPDRWRVPGRLRIPRDHLRQAYSACPSGDDPPSTPRRGASSASSACPRGATPLQPPWYPLAQAPRPRPLPPSRRLPAPRPDGPPGPRSRDPHRPVPRSPARPRQ